MKILAIIGSPRKRGNTYQVVQGIKNQLIAFEPKLEIEEIFLTDYHLELCKGCFSCFARGQTTCPFKDDHAILEQKMNEANGIIFAAPTYAMGVPGIMKNFIDRFAYTSHRPCLFDKAFLVVSTVGGIMGLKETLTQLSLLASGGKSLIKLGVPSPPVTLAGFEKRASKKIKKASKAFYQSLISKKRKIPGLADWAYFASFKAFTSFASYQKVSPADYEYYKDKEYFYTYEGHPISKLLGNTMKGIMKITLKLMIK